MHSWQGLHRQLVGTAYTACRDCIDSRQGLHKVLAKTACTAGRDCMHSWQGLHTELAGTACTASRDYIQSWQGLQAQMVLTACTSGRDCVNSWQRLLAPGLPFPFPSMGFKPLLRNIVMSPDWGNCCLPASSYWMTDCKEATLTASLRETDYPLLVRDADHLLLVRNGFSVDRRITL